MQEPHLVNNMFEAIQSITDEARRALDDPELSREQLLSAISVRLPDIDRIIGAYFNCPIGSHRGEPLLPR